MISNQLCRQIAAGTLHSLGAGIAWQQLLAKNTLRLGFMGGSVTQGFAGDRVHAGAYPALLTDALCKQGYQAEAFVCAEAGMGSMEGNLLADEWILSKKPDIVFLEFAINETTLKPSVIAYESLLRKLLTQPEPPVVCLFLLRNSNDYSAEGFMISLAEHYHLPCVRLRPGINPALEHGDLEWTDYADAESHPNADGHRLLAECLLYMLEQAENAADEPRIPLPEAWLDAPFQALKYMHAAENCEYVSTKAPVLPRHSPCHPIAWKLSKESGGLQFQAECSALLLVFEAHRLPEYGACRITVDGEACNPPVLQSNSIYAWGNARYAVVVPPDVRKMHTVVLEPTEESFYLLGFGICE